MKKSPHFKEDSLITRPNGDPVPVVDYKNSKVINTYWMPIGEFLQLEEVYEELPTFDAIPYVNESSYSSYTSLKLTVSFKLSHSNNIHRLVCHRVHIYE